MQEIQTNCLPKLVYKEELEEWQSAAHEGPLEDCLNA